MNFKIEGPLLNQSALCAPILRLLPEWFGIEEALLRYEREIESLPTFLAKEGEEVIGFLTIKRHFPRTAEVLVMGVVPAAHGKGIGRALMAAAEAHLRTEAVEYLQVKTLGPSNPDPGYARTHAFYEAMGFRPLEEFKQIWDANNPCLILVKKL